MNKKLLSRAKHRYLIHQVNREKIPAFSNQEIVRKRIIFEGKVQKVGFRFQVFLLAERMRLTGKVKNLASGAVELDIQGNEEAIHYVVKYMLTRKRLNISRIEEHYLTLSEHLSDFKIAQ